MRKPGSKLNYWALLWIFLSHRETYQPAIMNESFLPLKFVRESSRNGDFQKSQVRICQNLRGPAGFFLISRSVSYADGIAPAESSGLAIAVGVDQPCQDKSKK